MSQQTIKMPPIKVWNIEALTGYKPKTTFYQDFSIADRFGLGAVRDTYVRAKDAWKDNYEYITELTMVLNWKIWEHHETGNDELAKMYDELWRTMDEWCQDNLRGKALQYYFETTD